MLFANKSTKGLAGSRHSGRGNRQKFSRLFREVLESRLVLDYGLVISEFAASNQQGIQDEDGDHPDWIEVFNAGDGPINLKGYYLTDDPMRPKKWDFPDRELPPLGRLVIFASGKNRADSELHTNFRLNASGEYLALIEPDGEQVAFEYAPEYPAQHRDVSYGLTPAALSAMMIEGWNPVDSGRFFATPTPGRENSETGYTGKVADISVNIDRGFFDSAQDVLVTTSTPGATIVYTFDGTLPSLDNGIQSPAIGPDAAAKATINVSSTSTLRVAAFKQEFLASPVETYTYLFVDDIVHQSSDGQPPPGWPAGPVNNQRLDFGMDPDIVQAPQYSSTIKDALLDIPSMSIVMDPFDLFDPATGFFVNGNTALNDPRSWERAASVELINPDDSPGFQIDAGVRMRGGFSRLGDNPKHAFRLFFRSEYGHTKLRYPLFGDEGVDTFDNVDLRTAQVPSWSLCRPGNTATTGGCRFNTMLRDVFTRDTQRDLGQPYTRSRYYHLYLNGHYWGLFQGQERAEASYAETYFGGDKDDYDVVKIDKLPAPPGQLNPRQVAATDGDLDAWRQLWTIAKSGFEGDENYLRVQGLADNGARDPNLPVLLDVNNLIDYMLTTFYAGNLDGPVSDFSNNELANNWYGIRNRNGEDGFRFFVHDAEWTLLEVDENRLGPWHAGSTFEQSNPQYVHQQLMANAEYRLRFADRAHQLLFNGGALTVEASLQRLQSRVDEIELAIIAESARWGDAHREEPYTQEDWQTAVAYIRDTFIPQRTAIMLDQLRSSVANRESDVRLPLYPNNDAPEFTTREMDGTAQVIISAASEIYYTLDGSDPRRGRASVQYDSLIADNAFAAVRVPTDDTLGTIWTTTAFDDSQWETGITGIGFQRVGDDFESVINTSIETTMYGINSSVFVRIPFQVEAPNQFDRLQLDMVYDDGFVAYLNGIEIARSNAPETIRWNSRSRQHRTTPEITLAPETIDLSEHVNLLEVGRNVLAIHGMNSNSSGSDFLLSPRLRAGVTHDLGISSSAIAYSSPVELSQDLIVSARTFRNGEWSALHRHAFAAPNLQDRIPGDANDDGIFDSSDLVLVFLAGKYEDELDNNATFGEGDWNGDGHFDTNDLVFAFQAGNYVSAASPLAVIVDQLFLSDREVQQLARADLLTGFDLDGIHLEPTEATLL